MKSLIDHHRFGCPATWSDVKVQQSPGTNKYFCPKCSQLALLEELKQNKITAIEPKDKGEEP